MCEEVLYKTQLFELTVQWHLPKARSRFALPYMQPVSAGPLTQRTTYEAASLFEAQAVKNGKQR
jgi:hypothetical protein